MTDGPDTDADDALEDLLAWSMDAPASLLPLLPALYEGLEDLGARTDDVLALLANVAMPEVPHVLDLGCGKGAVAIALAQHHGAHVTGVDGNAAFIAHGRQRARTLGLSHCELRMGDLRDAAMGSAELAAPYDLVAMLALGDTLGDSEDRVAALRDRVRVGGLMLFDEAYVADTLPDSDPLRDDYPSHTALLEALCAHGDRVVATRTIDGPERAESYAAITDRLAQRADALAQTHPALAPELRDYVRRQRQALDTLGGPITGALILLERGAE